MERIVKRSITRSTTAKSARLKLDDSILNCLSALPPSCRDEDLEDLFYFIMESFQFTGVPVAYDEIDVDQVGSYHSAPMTWTDDIAIGGD